MRLIPLLFCCVAVCCLTKADEHFEPEDGVSPPDADSTLCLLPAAGYRYAVVVSETTAGDSEWRKVVSALKKKHNAKVFKYKTDVEEVRGELSKYFPKYVCFVVKPDEMKKSARAIYSPNPFVKKVHQLTRALDDDPYGDCIWGILTGYEAEDALRIAKHKKPLLVKRGLGANRGWVGWVKEGKAYSEGKDRHYYVKSSKSKEVIEKSDGPVDVTKLFVDDLNKNNIDAIWTSSHATERDFSGFRHNKRTGRIVPERGRLVGVDMRGKKYPIKSTNPKVYLPAGNCLIGNITGKNCMATAWMRSGVYQMFGYTVPTWYGYMGWGTANYFFKYGGRFTLAESFYLNNQTLLFNLKNRLVEGREQRGHNYDKDSVAFYGDPAWEARVYAEKDANVPPPVWETEIKKSGKTGRKIKFKLTIKFNHRVNFDNIKSHIFVFLPERLSETELLQKGDARAVEVTDNFIIVKYSGVVEKGKTKTITFTGKPIK